MSWIDDMRMQLCPNGVPLKTLGDVGTFVRGNGMQKSDLVDSGFPAIHYGQIHTSYETAADETISFVTPTLAARLRKAQPGDLIIVTTSEDDNAVGKAFAWLGGTAAAVSGDAQIYQHSLVPKYLSYLFQTDQIRDQMKRGITGTKVRRISGEHLAKIKVPVPPVVIQEEIVRIVDLFRSLKAELDGELRAELDSRRRQYDYYRDWLLSFSDRSDVKWLPLRDFGEFHRGRRFTKAEYAVQGTPCIHYGEIYTHYGTTATSVVSHLRSDLGTTLRFAQPGDVVVVDVGETVEDVGKAVAWIGTEPVAIHDHSYAFRHGMNPTYVSYCMQTAAFRAEKAKHVARTKVKTLLINGFGQIAIPLPALNEQERIVGILDEFHALVNSQSIGLSAELAARRRQYEYYRDRLLTFEETVA